MPEGEEDAVQSGLDDVRDALVLIKRILERRNYRVEIFADQFFKTSQSSLPKDILF